MEPNQWLAALSLVAQDSINGCSDKMKTGCPFDVLPVVRVGCKQHAIVTPDPKHPETHSAIWDCSPLNARGQPILKEGSNSRALCEEAMAGLSPGQGVAWSTSDGPVSIAPRENRWQFTISGAPGTTAKLHCRIPSTGTNDACQGLPLVVP
jgi:hypothetical protein